MKVVGSHHRLWYPKSVWRPKTSSIAWKTPFLRTFRPYRNFSDSLKNSPHPRVPFGPRGSKLLNPKGFFKGLLDTPQNGSETTIDFAPPHNPPLSPFGVARKKRKSKLIQPHMAPTGGEDSLDSNAYVVFVEAATQKGKTPPQQTQKKERDSDSSCNLFLVCRSISEVILTIPTKAKFSKLHPGKTSEFVPDFLDAGSHVQDH